MNALVRISKICTDTSYVANHNTNSVLNINKSTLQTLTTPPNNTGAQTHMH